MEAGLAEQARPGRTLETVIRAIDVATTVFTVSRMAAPVSASDVLSYSRLDPNMSLDGLVDLIRDREMQKYRARDAGADVVPDPMTETDEERIRRPFLPKGKDLRRLSQPRLDRQGRPFSRSQTFPPQPAPAPQPFPPAIPSAFSAAPPAEDPAAQDHAQQQQQRRELLQRMQGEEADVGEGAADAMDIVLI
jgi:hypothetical protein